MRWLGVLSGLGEEMLWLRPTPPSSTQHTRRSYINPIFGKYSDLLPDTRIDNEIYKQKVNREIYSF